MADFFDFLRDEYKSGAEKQSATPVLYIDPNRIPGFDAKLVNENVVELPNGEFKITFTLTERNFLAKHIAEQLDGYYTGLSKKLSEDQLIVLLRQSLNSGPFASQALKNDGVCLINEPKDDEIDPDKIYETSKLLGPQNPDKPPVFYKPGHILPFPMDEHVLRRLIGEHEGEHCNQEGISKVDKDAKVKTLNGEILSDRAALKTLREEGREAEVQAWIDLRVLSAAEGDPTHATSIFLDDPEFSGVTKDHFKAAQSFKDEMCRGVAERLGIPFDQAENLRYLDPRAFAKAVDEGLKDGSIPLKTRDMTDMEKNEVMAREMGLSMDEFDAPGSTHLNDVLALYDRLKAEGKFKTERAEPPYVRQYIEQYVVAVDRRFVADTTAKPEELTRTYKKNEPEVAAAKIRTEDEIRESLSDGGLKSAATFQLEWIVEAAVAKNLGISDTDAYNMRIEKPQEFYKLTEKLLKENKIPLQTTSTRSAEEERTMISQKLGITVAQVDRMDPDRLALISAHMRKEGAFYVNINNPFLKAEIESMVKKGLADPSLQDVPDGTEPANEAAAEKKVSSLKADLSGGDRAQMTINGMSVSGYFARQADPAMVAQLEIERIRQASLAQGNSVAKLPSPDPALA